MKQKKARNRRQETVQNYIEDTYSSYGITESERELLRALRSQIAPKRMLA